MCIPAREVLSGIVFRSCALCPAAESVPDGIAGEWSRFEGQIYMFSCIFWWLTKICLLPSPPLFSWEISQIRQFFVRGKRATCSEIFDCDLNFSFGWNFSVIAWVWEMRSHWKKCEKIRIFEREKRIFLRETSFFDQEINFFDEKIAFLHTEHHYTLKFVRQNFPNRQAHCAGHWKNSYRSPVRAMLCTQFGKFSEVS